jgi:3-hydroxyisobutyrate dehydrogenase
MKAMEGKQREMADARIGFIGLGNMGGRMTQCIIRAGSEVVGYDVREENISAAGATVAASASAVIDACDVVLLSLPDSHVVEAVVFGDDGLLAHARAGQIIMDLSTSSPASTRKIRALFADKGAEYLDAGISGGAAAADKGALTLMVGGDPDALDRVSDG